MSGEGETGNSGNNTSDDNDKEKQKPSVQSTRLTVEEFNRGIENFNRKMVEGEKPIRDVIKLDKLQIVPYDPERMFLKGWV
jgi:hypothetical protein